MAKKLNFKKKIGYVQTVLGVLILIAALISMSMPGYIVNKMQDAHVNTNEMMQDADVSMDIDTVEGNVDLQHSLTRAIVGLQNMVLFCLLEAVLIILSLMLILQGLVNVKE